MHNLGKESWMHISWRREILAKYKTFEKHVGRIHGVGKEKLAKY